MAVVYPTNKRYSPPCDARLAEGNSLVSIPSPPPQLPIALLNPILFSSVGCIRGFYVGALWGAFFHRYDAKPVGPDVSKGQALAHALRIRTGTFSCWDWGGGLFP